MRLRPYQSALITDVRAEWQAGARNVLMRLDTGGGKTVILAVLVQEHPGASCVIAHRQELVGQLSLTLASHGVRHNIIAAADTRRAIVAEHMAVLGMSFYDPGAKCAVASVDTLVRAEGLGAWAVQVTLWVVDEAHHVVVDNKWHTALGLFTHPHCHGLGPSATPSRADGKGLGAHADGVFHSMVQGPPMSWLMDQGYLTRYKMTCVESDMQLLEEEIGASGDWSTVKLRNAARESHIVGDVVDEYRKWGAGKLGITFSSDTETAAELVREYRKAGVRAELLTGKTESGMRRQMLRQFKARQLDQIVAVDVVSEGYDLPAIEVETQSRKTASLATYMQQFGRALRPMYAAGYDLETQEGRLAAIAASSKPYARIIDHVGNFFTHGPPQRPRPWTLDRRERGVRGLSYGIPMQPCLGTKERRGCFEPYPKTEKVCPFCGTPAPEPEPAARSSPGMVAGDLSELDDETVARLCGAIEELDATIDDYRNGLLAKGMPVIGIMANVKRHAFKQAAQAELRQAMAAWGGPRHAAGRNDSQIQREFFYTFGIDVASAMALGVDEANTLKAKVEVSR